MLWKDKYREFEKGIRKVDELGYNKIYLLGFLTNKYSDNMKMEFVIGDKNYHPLLTKRDFERRTKLWCMSRELIRK